MLECCHFSKTPFLFYHCGNKNKKRGYGMVLWCLLDVEGSWLTLIAKDFATSKSSLCFQDGEGSGTPLQSSCLENPMDGGAWWAAVHGVIKSRARLSDFTFTFHFHALEKEMATHSSVLAWRIPGTGEPGGLPSLRSHRVGHDWSNLAAAYFQEANFLKFIFLLHWFPRETSGKNYGNSSGIIKH